MIMVIMGQELLPSARLKTPRSPLHLSSLAYSTTCLLRTRHASHGCRYIENEYLRPNVPSAVVALEQLSAPALQILAVNVIKDVEAAARRLVRGSVDVEHGRGCGCEGVLETASASLHDEQAG